MFYQESYGRVENLPEPREGGTVYVECTKCKGKFSLEKRHKELHMCSMFFGRKKDKTLTPATPRDVEFSRLCDTCFNKLKLWLGKE